MAVGFRSVPTILLPCSVSQGTMSPGSLALQLLGGLANGRHWQKVDGWEEGKDWGISPLTASCGTSISICVPSMALSPSSGIQGLLGCPTGPLATTNSLNFKVLPKLPPPGNMNHYSHYGKEYGASSKN